MASRLLTFRQSIKSELRVTAQLRLDLNRKDNLETSLSSNVNPPQHLRAYPLHPSSCINRLKLRENLRQEQLSRSRVYSTMELRARIGEIVSTSKLSMKQKQSAIVALLEKETAR